MLYAKKCTPLSLYLVHISEDFFLQTRYTERTILSHGWNHARIRSQIIARILEKL